MDIREIAKRAKVSTATVSRAINRVPTVNPALAKRVWSVIEELGYYPNTQARALVSGRSRIFGLIISEITNPFFPEIVQVFETIAVQHRYEILLTSTGNDPKRMESAVRRMIERRVEGVAIMTFGMEEVLLEDLKLRQVPLVFVDVGPPRPRVSNIRIDYLQRNPPGGAASGSSTPRKNCIHNRASASEVCDGPESRHSCVPCRKLASTQIQTWWLKATIPLKAVLRLSADCSLEPVRPTAVLCSNDMTAIGVMRKSHDAGLSIPRDISVIGFDDIRLAQFVIPPLTSVQMSQTELARLAFNALLSEVERETPAPNGTDYFLKTNLVLRESTGLIEATSKPAEKQR